MSRWETGYASQSGGTRILRQHGGCAGAASFSEMARGHDKSVALPRPQTAALSMIRGGRDALCSSRRSFLAKPGRVRCARSREGHSRGVVRAAVGSRGPQWQAAPTLVLFRALLWPTVSSVPGLRQGRGGEATIRDRRYRRRFARLDTPCPQRRSRGRAGHVAPEPRRGEGGTRVPTGASHPRLFRAPGK